MLQEVKAIVIGNEEPFPVYVDASEESRESTDYSFPILDVALLHILVHQVQCTKLLSYPLHLYVVLVRE